MGSSGLKVLLGPDRKGAKRARHPQQVRGGEEGAVVEEGVLPRSSLFSADGVDIKNSSRNQSGHF